TTHFTDFINELLKSPEMPETQAFVPTAMKDLEAAHPGNGYTPLRTPTANRNGTAELNYPLDIPPGRNGMQPNLALTYSSSGGGSWLSDGWDIPLSSLSVDTRWGVPRYDADLESDVYLLDGEQLVTFDEDGRVRAMPQRTTDWTERLPDKTRFYSRVDRKYDSIVRHGNNPSNYWWEVYDRTGVVHRYGHYETLNNDSAVSTLCNDRGDIAKWCLAESEDPYGNMVRYTYDTVHDAGINGGIVKGRQIYPAEIRYTMHRDGNGTVDDTGLRRVVFVREDNDVARRHSYCFQLQEPPSAGSCPERIPAAIDCRHGFKEVTASLLTAVEVMWRDTIMQMWRFGMKYGPETGWKVKLTSMGLVVPPEQDYSQWIVSNSLQGKGVMYWGDAQTGDDVLHFVYKEAPDALFGDEVNVGAVWRAHEGGLFPYGEDVKSTGISLDPVGDYAGELSVTALGGMRGYGFSAGGGLSAGLGYSVFWTELTGGGNFNINGSYEEGVLQLVDLDGDGLADKVFRNTFGDVYYRKNMLLPDGTFFYGPAKRLNIDKIIESTTWSSEFGLQLSLGVSLTGSYTHSRTTTTTYFCDINGDGLADLVTDNGAYYNNLVNGLPVFSIARRHSEPGVADTVYSTATPCGYVIHDNAINDSVYCPVVKEVYNKDYAIDANIDSALSVDFISVGIVVDSIRNHVIYGHKLKHDCSEVSKAYDVGLGPRMESVRVWVAPFDGFVTVRDSIRMLPDTTGGVARSRHADGVHRSVQWLHEVTDFVNITIIGTRNDTIGALCGTLGVNDTVWTIHDTTIEVKTGDILFFRLQSGDNRGWDRADWRHTVTYTELSSDADIYGMPVNRYNSVEDFMVSGDNCFQAPAAGKVLLDIDVATGTLQGNSLGVKVCKNGSSIENYNLTSNQTGTIHVSHLGNVLIPVSRGDSIQVKLYGALLNQTTWGRVICKPHYRFIPSSGSEVRDTLSYHIAPNVPYSPFYPSLAYRRLFGPLYRGWGQFTYFAEGTEPSDLINPLTLVYNLGTFSAGDTAGMKEAGLYLDVNNLGFSMDDLSSVMDNTHNYNPLSAFTSRWRRMEADSRLQAWVGFGNSSLLTRTMVTNSFPQELYARDEAAGIKQYDCPAPAPTAEYPKVRTQARVTVSENWNFSGSVGGPVSVGKSSSHGSVDTESDCIDLNGDRYPDIVSGGSVQYTMPYGGLSPHVTAVSYSGSSSGSRSKGVNVSAGDPSQDTRPMFGKTSDRAVLSSVPVRPQGGGGSVAGNDSTSIGFSDINGDGLPDMIKGNGIVRLNIGYGFLPEEVYGSGYMRKGSHFSLSTSASASVPA
ncbi:MAG: hypothetical protein J6T56_07545, partial [Bacteroidales bacterium]|nr:hypothetical protein [Bacteroidales bacterium]